MGFPKPINFVSFFNYFRRKKDFFFAVEFKVFSFQQYFFTSMLLDYLLTCSMMALLILSQNGLILKKKIIEIGFNLII